MLTLVDHIHSFERCLALGADIVYPGHGNLIEQPRLLIEKRLQRIEEKSAKILELIKSGLNTANDVAKSFYQEKYIKEFPLVMSEVIGHIDYLEYQGKVEKKLSNKVFHYFSK